MFGGKRKCRRIKRLASDSLDSPRSALSARIDKMVTAHLDQCEDCRAEIDFYREIKSLAGNMEQEQAPSYLWDRINIQLDEHPWGDPEETRKTGFGSLNWPGYAFSLAVVLILSLVPASAIDDNSDSIGSTAFAREYDPGLEDVSLYMVSQSDHFPIEVRDYYVTQLQALDSKIRKVRNTLEKFPNNRVVREQLTIVYGQKIKLYRELSRSIIDLKPEQNGRWTEFDFDRGSYYE